jgi:hypothetical protein
MRCRDGDRLDGHTDFQPATSINGLIEYAAKYCSKPEKESKSYSDLSKEVIKHVRALG